MVGGPREKELFEEIKAKKIKEALDIREAKIQMSAIANQKNALKILMILQTKQIKLNKNLKKN